MEEKYIRKIIFDIEHHNPDLFKSIGLTNLQKFQTDAFIKFLYRMVSFIQELGFLSKRTYFSFINSLLLGLSKNDLIFFSLHSNALTSNVNVLREKTQYKKVQFLNEQLKEFFSAENVEFKYISILPDYDETFPFSIYDVAWDKNKDYIEEMSGMETIRLSKLAPGCFEYINEHLASFVNIADMNKEIQYYANLINTVVDFHADKDFCQKQIKTYSIVGIILEELYPHGVLLDIQKKRYPFEQPFYNFARKNKLPIVLCGQELRKFNSNNITKDTIIKTFQNTH